jgi:hypothetical protein
MCSRNAIIENGMFNEAGRERNKMRRGAQAHWCMLTLQTRAGPTGPDGASYNAVIKLELATSGPDTP